jgi:hypothetical protein
MVKVLLKSIYDILEAHSSLLKFGAISLGDVEVGPLGLDLNTFNMCHLAQSKIREKLPPPKVYSFGILRLGE